MKLTKHSLLTILIFVGLVVGLVVGEFLFRYYRAGKEGAIAKTEAGL